MINKSIEDFKYRMYEAHLAGIFRPTKNIFAKYRSSVTYTNKEKLFLLIDEYHRYKQCKENNFILRLHKDQNISYCERYTNDNKLKVFLIMRELHYSPDIDDLIKKLRICRSLTYGVKSKNKTK